MLMVLRKASDKNKLCLGLHNWIRMHLHTNQSYVRNKEAKKRSKMGFYTRYNLLLVPALIPCQLWMSEADLSSIPQRQSSNWWVQFISNMNFTSCLNFILMELIYIWAQWSRPAIGRKYRYANPNICWLKMCPLIALHDRIR